ncbi:MAG: hypothetical protein K8L91_20555 [Anaerolineae bacterium]|nr:hypothetical protein [Anaerolineae bacterium]
MGKQRQISLEEAGSVGTRLGVDWAKITVEQFRRGLEVELEYGAHDLKFNAPTDDLMVIGKIVWADMEEISNHYRRLGATGQP